MKYCIISPMLIAICSLSGCDSKPAGEQTLAPLGDSAQMPVVVPDTTTSNMPVLPTDTSRTNMPVVAPPDSVQAK